MADKVSECVKTGMEFLGRQFDFQAIRELLERFFLKLGIRRTNKFCNTLE
jgi:hypothetical protein